MSILIKNYKLQYERRLYVFYNRYILHTYLMQYYTKTLSTRIYTTVYSISKLIQ